jgi:small subunit ribosomal protein S20
MPIKKSAKKALRQSLKRKAQNSAYKEKIKNLTKEIKKLVADKKTKEAKNILPQLYKILDKAAKVNTIKKNTADRKKSRITKFITKSQG